MSEQAHRWGLVNRLVEPGAALAVAKELGATVAANAPGAVRASKEIVSEAAADRVHAEGGAKLGGSNAITMGGVAIHYFTS